MRTPTKHKVKTITYKKLQSRCFCNSSWLGGKLFQINNRRLEWVGIGLIDIGPADGTEIKVLP